MASLIPSVFAWDNFYPQRFLDDYFDMSLFPESHLLLPSMRPYRLRTRRQPKYVDSGISGVKNDKESFQVKLDVSQFSPDELIVKTDDNYIIIHGKHEEKPDEHGFIKREFTRRYMLPSDVEPETVKSNLTPDGVLTVEGPKKAIESVANERTVPITMIETPKVPVEEK